MSESPDFPSPTIPAADLRAVLVGYLDYFRSRVRAKLVSLPTAELTASRLPSGWTPLELVVHLTNVERRWLVWGFEGAVVDDPWADQGPDGSWRLPPDADRETVLAGLDAQAAVSSAVLARHRLDELGRPGPRWDGAPPATLQRVLLHLIQEYARHLGHLDIVCELAGAELGE